MRDEQDIAYETLSPDAYVAWLKAHYYRWWTVFTWWDDGGGGVKLGPVSFNAYRWFDGRMRLGMTFNFGREHILWGGPLA